MLKAEDTINIISETEINIKTRLLAAQTHRADEKTRKDLVNKIINKM